MGPANTKQSTSWLTQRYNFIEHLPVPHFGTVAVFKKKQENYDYIGVLERAVRMDYSKEIQRELCFLTGKNISLPFLKIFMVEVGQLDLHDSMLVPQSYDRRGRCGVEVRQEKLYIYMELLTYTLQEHLAYKRDSKSQMNLKEYCYVLKTLIAAAFLYEEWRLEYLQLDLTSNCIFIKPNGEIKLFPFKSNYIREAVECGDDCFSWGCLPNGEGRGECRTYSFASPKKKQGKYLKQIKNISLQLFCTVNPNVSDYVRSIPNFNRSFLLSYEELEVLRGLQQAVINSKSLKQIYEILGEMEQDYLQVQRQQGTAQVQINNPQVYNAFVHHLSSVSKNSHSPHQHVTRNIFGVQPNADSQSNTHSNLSPRSQQRSSFKKCLDKQPQITVPAYFQ